MASFSFFEHAVHVGVADKEVCAHLFLLAQLAIVNEIVVQIVKLVVEVLAWLRTILDFRLLLFTVGLSLVAPVLLDRRKTPVQF